MLLKIFLPAALIILPILLPINNSYNNGSSVQGLDKLGWQNYDPAHTDRLWAHLILAVLLLIWTCYVIFEELTGYIRVRQEYLTSPQHRLRASATTVLVTSIPRKWLTYEALDSLFDAFPGGVRNIWMNRNFDKLNNKVQLRNKLAKMLERAETDLIRKAKKKQMRMGAKQKGSGSVKEVGVDTKVKETEPVQEDSWKPNISIQILIAIGQGFGQSFTKLGRSLIHGVAGAPRVVSEVLDAVNHGGGLMLDMDSQGDEASQSTTHKSERTMKKGHTLQGTSKERPITPNSKTEPQEFASSAGTAIDLCVNRSLPKANRYSTESQKESPKDVEPNHVEIETFDCVDWIQKDFFETDPTRGWNIWNDCHKITLPCLQLHGKGNTLDQKRTSNEVNNNDMDLRTVYNEDYADDKGFDTEPEWKKYLSEKDRHMTRLPLFGLFNWLPFMPPWTLMGKMVDTIYYCRREITRLNLEIESDQQNPEYYPLLNSAFIQFSNQIAAHMACQSVSHHLPNHMTPRIVEMAPGDIIWDNLSIRWWERLLRLGVVIVITTGLIILWAVPVSFTSAIFTLSTLATYKGFTWINKMPKWLEIGLSGVLPPLVANFLLDLLPVFLYFVAKQGAPTGMSAQFIIQDMYFAFSFVQLFLVVTISTSLVKVIGQIGKEPTSTVTILAENIPKASNYFFSYMILQALSVSAGNLAQIPTLVLWFLWRPITDTTPRQKFQRQFDLPTVPWGTFFPAYTNLACIGLIYSIIAPLIIVFNIITWTLFWIVYRYQTLYVNAYKFDTGGLLFPRAVSQLFVGIYVMELALIGLFLLVQDSQNRLACLPQATIMIVMLVLTVLYQMHLNAAFKPLYRYMPITLEGDAVRRGEEFERTQAERWQVGPSQEKIDDGEQGEGIASMFSWKQQQEDAQQETQDKAHGRHGSVVVNHTQDGIISPLDPENASQPPAPNSARTLGARNTAHTPFGRFIDAIEDLTAAERDTLIQRAFQHEALRARRPVIWIPRDDLGVSDDEIKRTNAFCRGDMWISNEFASLDRKCSVRFEGAPPDFSDVDLIEL